jgi:hypothetical protein
VLTTKLDHRTSPSKFGLLGISEWNPDPSFNYCLKNLHNHLTKIYTVEMYVKVKMTWVIKKRLLIYSTIRALVKLIRIKKIIIKNYTFQYLFTTFGFLYSALRALNIIFQTLNTSNI